MDFQIELSLALFLIIPLIGSIACLALWRMPELVRWCALLFSAATFCLAVSLYFAFPQQPDGWFGLSEVSWIPSIGASFLVGIDGLAMMMILITSLLVLLGVLAGWSRMRSRESLYYSLFLLMQAGVMGVFISLDLLLFYVFWELMLIPILFLVGIFGHGKAIKAAIRFFIYALSGSLLMLVGILSLYILHGQQTGDYSFSLFALQQTELSIEMGRWVLLAFLLALFIKTPLVPVHRWLPAIYRSSPAGVLMGGVIIKTGIYAMLRFCPSLLPQAWSWALPGLAAMALISILYAGWIACVQRDIFRLLAYSSISHAGFILLGIAAWQTTAIDGSMLQMVNHAIVAGALLYMSILIRERTGTASLDELGGLWGRMPKFSAFYLFFVMALLGLPGTNSFAGEFLILAGLAQANPLLIIPALPALLITTVYCLRLLVGTIWGEDKRGLPMADVTLREAVILTVLVILTLWLGMNPAPFLEPMQGSVMNIMNGGLQ